MNDDEVWDAMKQTLSGVQMDRSVEEIEQRGRARRRNRTLVGVAAGGGLAAVVALALVLPMGAQPGTGTAPTGSDPRAVATGDAPATPAAPVGNMRLVALATDIQTSSRSLPGDASLVIQKVDVRRGKLPDRTRYHLYADNGAYYYTEAKRELPRVVARGENLGNGAHSRAVAAAHYAATGELAEARQRMVNSPYDSGRPPSRAEMDKERMEMLRQKGVKNPKPLTDEAWERITNNHLWVYSLDALTAGGGHPEVRAGVLRLLSTIPDVTVADSTTDGQPTLTITAGPDVYGGEGEHVLTINARNGVPIRATVNDRELKTSWVETFQVSRVKVADIKAGRF